MNLSKFWDPLLPRFIRHPKDMEKNGNLCFTALAAFFLIVGYTMWETLRMPYCEHGPLVEWNGKFEADTGKRVSLCSRHYVLRPHWPQCTKMNYGLPVVTAVRVVDLPIRRQVQQTCPGLISSIG